MIQLKTKALPSWTKKIPYQLRIVAACTLVAPFCLANPVGAFSPTPARQLTGVQSVATQPNLIAESNWQRFSSSPGNFSLSFPGKPTEEKRSDAYTFTLQDEESFYILSYSDMPNSVAQTVAQNPDAIAVILDVAPGVFVNKINAKLTSSKKISLDGYPGKEFEFTYRKFINGTGRVYVVGQRMYLMVVVTNQQENVPMFLNSFQLSGK